MPVQGPPPFFILFCSINKKKKEFGLTNTTRILMQGVTRKKMNATNDIKEFLPFLPNVIFSFHFLCLRAFVAKFFYYYVIYARRHPPTDQQ